ncbi:hypothetical protein [Geoglobus acetivorans]|uniref:Cytochrome c family protein n=1 Tax=Geoglobus acetivorans TaxID=565033 RepID=A0ABZ3H5Z1_GEOAI|nr:hypothetical protein [Geoglobus acetivorans]
MKRTTLLFFVIALAVIVPMCSQSYEKAPEKTPVPEQTPFSDGQKSVTSTPVPETGTDYGSTAPELEGPVCENCHLNSKRQYVPQADKIEGHLDGTKFCQYCHVKGDDVVRELGNLHHSKYSDCSKCHVNYDLEKMDCGSCHAYPDPFEPSNGNLLKIHLSRGVGCKDCHGTDFLRIHQDKKIFPDKFGIEN